MKTVNVGVIGVGAMGENHVRVYHKMEEANLLAVSDVSERALKKIEKKFIKNLNKELMNAKV